MKLGYSLTNAAVSDLYAIGRYTLKNWGKEQYKKYMTQLESCFEQLADDPLKGKDCGEIREGYRKMRVGSHIVFYRMKSAREIEIVRILHSRMDVDRQLKVIQVGHF